MELTMKWIERAGAESRRDDAVAFPATPLRPRRHPRLARSQPLPIFDP